jgi:hypothetical protein
MYKIRIPNHWIDQQKLNENSQFCLDFHHRYNPNKNRESC